MPRETPSRETPSRETPSRETPSRDAPSRETPHHQPTRALRVGIGGPVGSGKTALVAALCRSLSGRVDMAVVTNDIYTSEDAEQLLRAGVLAPDRIVGVETGCCPHTAIRDDVTANLDAVDGLEARHPGLELVLVESGGDNLTATFSPRLADVQLFVIDVAGGDKVPRKGGPGVCRSDLLVINKTDLAPFVGADLSVMASDAARVRDGRPVVFTSLVEDPLASQVGAFVEAALAAGPAAASAQARLGQDHAHDHSHPHPHPHPH